MGKAKLSAFCGFFRFLIGNCSFLTAFCAFMEQERYILK